jgi:type I restriction enzyme, S subunit
VEREGSIVRELPKGWANCQLKELADVLSGIGFPKEYQGQAEGDLGFFKVGDISEAVLCHRGVLNQAEHYVSIEIAHKLKGKPILPGATVFAKIGEAIKLNRRALVAVPCLIDNNVMSVKAYVDNLDRYLYYFMNTVDFSEKARSTTVPSLRKGDVEELPIPLPPLNEQKRIAQRLDLLLTRIDKAKAHLDRIPPLLKRFRQSVLAAATSGKLTEDWREANEVDWIDVSLGDVLTDIRYGTSKKCNYECEGTPVLRIPNIGDGTIDHDDMKYAEFDQAEIKKLALTKGDVLIIRSNGSVSLVGKSSVISESEEGFLFAGYLIRLRVQMNLLIPEFLHFHLSSQDVRNQIEITARSTSGVNNINTEEIRSLGISLPPLEEQHEIVRRVETLFAKADRIEAQYQKARQAVDRLTPALLAKAFRGELVPQDPNDEPASVLLERIKAEKEGREKKEKGRSGRRKKVE